MIILPGGGLINNGNELQAVLDDHVLQQASREFLSVNQEQLVPSSEPSLCVFQGEEAVIDYGASPGVYIGSEDATTCVILLVRCPVSKLAYVAHHDSSTCHADPHDLLQHLDKFQELEAYLVGGFAEGSGASEATCCSLLRLLHHHTPKRVAIKLACIWTANLDATTGGPRARNCSLHCGSGRPSPAGFLERGPDLPRRFAFHHCSPTSSLTCIANTEEPNRIQLPGYRIKLSLQHCYYLARLLKLPDEHFLNECSTSPEFEGPNFVSDIQASCRFLLQGQTQGDPREVSYEWTRASGWVATPPKSDEPQELGVTVGV